LVVNFDCDKENALEVKPTSNIATGYLPQENSFESNAPTMQQANFILLT